MQTIAVEDQTQADANAIHCDNLSFDFGGPTVIRDLNLTLPAGSRCLLVGANGAGKSTLLQLLAGKRLVRGTIFVLGKRAFFDAPAGVTYLGTEWAVNPVVRQDVPVTRLLKSQGILLFFIRNIL
jgi:CCR4-NOT complex subunit CAF16